MADTYSFNVTIDIPKELCRDVLITAVEGGINYWASVQEYEHEGPNPFAVAVDQVDLNRYDDNNPGEHYRVDDHDIARAIYNMVQREPTHPVTARMIRAAFNFESGDYDYDAGDADCVFQYACFGEVIYG
jgi:hypothetical protein